MLNSFTLSIETEYNTLMIKYIKYAMNVVRNNVMYFFVVNIKFTIFFITMKI